jgi:predicted outer membrane repeat protein
MEIHRGAQVIPRNLSITGGNEFFEGGGIKNLGWLALDNVAVTQNTAGNAGGGIATMSGAELYLFDSTVSANTAIGTTGTFQGGGGIYQG